MIAFNLLLRPSLAIFGLILSYSVFGSIIWFVNATFATAGKSMMIGAGGTIGLLVMVAILTYIHYQVALRSFSLITQVPDRVTRWFGHGGDSSGEDQDAKGSTTAIVGHLTSKTEQIGSNIGNRAGAPRQAASGTQANPKSKGSGTTDKSGDQRAPDAGKADRGEN